jgi:hypothetical protein
MPAYANGQRYASKNGRERADSQFSDRDATWGHRSGVSTRKGGGFYGYRVHMAVCTLRKLYKQRGAVEREFGRLKHDWALAPLRVRGLDRLRLHADLTVLAQLSRALGRARSLATARAAQPAALAA